MNISAILPRSAKYPTGQSNRIRSFAAELERRTRAAYRKAAEAMRSRGDCWLIRAARRTK